MIQINKEQVLSDLKYVVNKIGFFPKPSSLIQNYDSLSYINEVSLKTNYTFLDKKKLFSDIKNVWNILYKINENDVTNFVSIIRENAVLLNTMAKNFLDYMEDINYYEIPFYEKIKNYNEKEFKEIILSYFGKYSDNYKEIVESYFDDERIHMEYTFDDCSGLFYEVNPLDKGYLFVNGDRFNSFTASVLAHELGHAIDAHTFIFPQKKIVQYYSDILIEIPSLFFENDFADSLIKNYIDRTGGLLYQNYNLTCNLKNITTLYDLTKKDNIDNLLNLLDSVSITDITCSDLFDCSLDENDIEDQEGLDEEDVVDDEEDLPIELQSFNTLNQLKDSVIYSLGYIISIYLQLIKESSNNVDFSNRFHTFISSRKELNLEELIQMLDVDVNDFVNLKYVKDKINNNELELKKRFKLL